MTTLNPEHLPGTWIHSDEEDRDGQLVFRRPSFAFPLRRMPRRVLRLDRDGRAKVGGPGPDDRSDLDSTRWDLAGDRLTVDGSSAFSGQFRIVEVSATRLVLRPNDEE